MKYKGKIKMKCPNCQTTELEIKNNLIKCTHCYWKIEIQKKRKLRRTNYHFIFLMKKETPELKAINEINNTQLITPDHLNVLKLKHINQMFYLGNILKKRSITIEDVDNTLKNITNRTRKEFFKIKLITEQEAIDFIETLEYVYDSLFHFEDDPNEIIHSATGKKFFDDDEIDDINQRVNELFELLDDPFTIGLELQN